MLIIPGEVVQGEHSYTIGQTVGAGAYACVYRAADELGRVVALKEYFPPARPRDAASLKSVFERERFILARVSAHPQIPTFYEGFIADNQFYLAQEFIDGVSLDEIIRKNKVIDREWMLKWAIELCEALCFLHDHQIVHHDLKPPNLRITPDRRLKLLDYGAAIYLGKDDSTAPDSVQNDTELFGTEGYLPPEVEETFKADIRTDIFALGCVLYEMVMGEAPEQQSINERNLYVTTPLMQRKDVDLAFVKLVTTALSYNTEFRYANAGLFAAELRKIAQAMLFVSTKSLDFGSVELGSAKNRKFKIYNGGGAGELVGDVRPKSAWLRAEMPQFRTQKRDVIIVADADKVPKRNKVVRGQVEVVTRDQYDAEGRMLARADRWLVDCYIKVNASAAQISVAGLGSGSTLAAHATPGGKATVRLTLHNSGQMPAEGVLQPSDDQSGVSISPAEFRLKPNDNVTVEAAVATTSADAIGSRRQIAIDALIDGQRVLTIPITLIVESVIDYFKGIFLRALGGKRGADTVPSAPAGKDVAGAHLLPPPKQ